MTDSPARHRHYNECTIFRHGLDLIIISSPCGSVTLTNGHLVTHGFLLSNTRPAIPLRAEQSAAEWPWPLAMTSSDETRGLKSLPCQKPTAVGLDIWFIRTGVRVRRLCDGPYKYRLKRLRNKMLVVVTCDQNLILYTWQINDLYIGTQSSLTPL